MGCKTGRIVTAAAGLLAVVFAGFLVGGFVPIKAIGLGLTLAVGGHLLHLRRIHAKLALAD